MDILFAMLFVICHNYFTVYPWQMANGIANKTSVRNMVYNWLTEPCSCIWQMANKTLKTFRRRRIDDIYYLFMLVLLHFLAEVNLYIVTGGIWPPSWEGSQIPPVTNQIAQYFLNHIHFPQYFLLVGKEPLNITCFILFEAMKKAASSFWYK